MNQIQIADEPGDKKDMILNRASKWSALLVAAGAVCFGLTPGRLSAEPASSADRFVDAMGVNTHLKFTTGSNPYANAQILALLGQSGLRHIRDDMQVGNSANSRLASIYNSYGIRVNWVPYTWERTAPTAAQLVSSLKANAFFESIEGPNEPDAIPAPISYNGFTDNPAGNNYAGTRAWQNDMFTGVKGDPQTSATLMFSPAMAFSLNAQYLAPISLDYEAMHSYPGGKNPVNNLDNYNIPNVNLMVTPSKPIVATETGYHTATNDTSTHPYVSQRAQGKYLPRLFAEYFNRGIRTTYIYEFVDEGTNYADKEAKFGLVNYDLTPKPVFTNLQNLITLLGEGTWDANNKVWNVPSFTPSSGLDYTLAGSTNNVHHTLLQKSTGEFYLLLWQEVSTFYNNGGGGNIANWKDITNATVPVTLTLNTPITSAATYLLGSLTPTATYANPSSMSLSVPDEVLVVRLVTGPLLAAFSGSPTNGSVPLSVSFADSSTGLITNRFWNFGDGSTTNTTALNVSHVYANVGTYTVSLVVSGSSGSSTNTRVNYVVVDSQPSSLLARWSFSTGTSADLTSDNGVYTFIVAGVGTPTYNAGGVSLANGTELVVAGINSAALPALATNATVWVKMKFDSVPGNPPTFFFGLVKAAAPADWGQMAMTGYYGNSGGFKIGQFSKTTTGEYGQLFVAPPAVNTPFTMALVLTSGLDENGFPNATLTRFQTYVNGVSVGSGSGAGTNVASLAFALGTLKASGGAGYTFDEARVYDQALTASQIAQIGSPTANLDIATTAWNVPVTIAPLTNDADPNGYPLTVVGVSPTNATASVIGGTNVLVTPTQGSLATVSVGYTITNGNSGAASSLITVTVTTPPTPVVTSVMRSGTGLVLSGTSGAANGIYQVLSSTNVALPMANWTPVSTNTFDAGGGFNVTNTIDPARPNIFFQIKQ
ncbi:MAG: PKD domain-containing protein [Verrucomicrobiales bacterium]|nr:PKD domain-containing protein [Verrucomicrobiales bacterium]